MSTKGFMLLLVGVLVLGGSLGGTFFGGLALGKSQGEETAEGSLAAGVLGAAGQQSSGQPGQLPLDQIRERIQSGEVSPEDFAQLREQFQSQFGADHGGGGFGGGGFRGRGNFADGAVLSGTVEAVDGNMITLSTPRGALQATVDSDTVIRRVVTAAIEDLAAGMQLTVAGERGEGGTISATLITVVPEGSQLRQGDHRGAGSAGD